ncbi:MAG: hypothetical protein KAJ95_11450, partial [Gammaproteobacteria bacterium]|nr:hypothetical protein [Gammaproteobacteria bacterium]
ICAPQEVPLGCNAEVGFFGLRAAVHELIRGSLDIHDLIEAASLHCGDQAVSHVKSMISKKTVITTGDDFEYFNHSSRTQ